MYVYKTCFRPCNKRIKICHFKAPNYFLGRGDTAPSPVGRGKLQPHPGTSILWHLPPIKKSKFATSSSSHMRCRRGSSWLCDREPYGFGPQAESLVSLGWCICWGTPRKRDEDADYLPPQFRCGSKIQWWRSGGDWPLNLTNSVTNKENKET